VCPTGAILEINFPLKKEKPADPGIAVENPTVV
jgi:hypothetical protein